MYMGNLMRPPPLATPVACHACTIDEQFAVFPCFIFEGDDDDVFCYYCGHHRRYHDLHRAQPAEELV